MADRRNARLVGLILGFLFLALACSDGASLHRLDILPCAKTSDCPSGQFCLNGACQTMSDGDSTDSADRSDSDTLDTVAEDEQDLLEREETLPSEGEAEAGPSENESVESDQDGADETDEALDGDDAADGDGREEADADADTAADTDADADTETDPNACSCTERSGTYCSNEVNGDGMCQMVLPQQFTIAQTPAPACTSSINITTIGVSGPQILNNLCQNTFGPWRVPGASPNAYLMYVNGDYLIGTTAGNRPSGFSCSALYMREACPAVHCKNGKTDFGESAMDCGGQCGGCQLGQACNRQTDCLSSNCENGTCGHPICGDGLVAKPDEECDDGNSEPGDGCEGCKVTAGYLCEGQPSTCIPPCKTNADCADYKLQERPCNTFSCLNSSYGTDTSMHCYGGNRIYEGPARTNVAGDCKVLLCNSDGAPTPENDDNDYPPSTSNCLTYTCDNGTLIAAYALEGTACDDHGGDRCDALGHCVSCLRDDECPASTKECKRGACVAGECGFVSLAANTVLAQQVPADCKLRVCDGLGSVKTVTYPSDVPISDNNSCTKEVCQNGVPTYDVLAMKGKACNENGGKICDGSGVCGECQDYWGCPDQGECLLGKCQAPTCNDQIANGLESGTDCGGGEAGSGCPKCPLWGRCKSNSDCQNNHCDGLFCLDP